MNKIQLEYDVFKMYLTKDKFIKCLWFLMGVHNINHKYQELLS